MPGRFKKTRTTKLFGAVIFILTSVFAAAQPTTGNITTNFSSPNGSSKTISHTQNSGDDRLLIVITQTPNGSADATACSYGGVSMTSSAHWNDASWQTRVWSLEDPAEGSNNVVVTYGGGQWNKSAHVALSFTNSTGVGATGRNSSGGWNTQRSVSLTVEDNSIMIGFGLSTGGTASYLSYTTSWNSGLAGGKGSFGGLSGTLSAGSSSFAAKDNGGHVYPMAVEIKTITNTLTIIDRLYSSCEKPAGKISFVLYSRRIFFDTK